MKKSSEKNDHLIIGVKKLTVTDQQVSDHWNSILVKIAKPGKETLTPSKKLNN